MEYKMVRQDILGGLKLALSKGQTLEAAMQSFYNSGYKKEEIEEAARALYSEFSQQSAQPPQYAPQQQKIQATQPPIQEKKEQPITSQPTLVKKPVQIQPVPQTPPQIQIQHQQIISNYDQPRRGVDFVTIILVIILFALLGVLAAVFFFKPEIVEFLNKYLE